MQVEALGIPDILLLTPPRFRDERGFFSEVWSRKALRAAGLPGDFEQENHSLSRTVGTVRGLHYQTPPVAQGKLVRVVRGRIFDVAVDLRRRSPSYGQWVGAELSADDGRMIWIPAGFAHGFCTLEPDSEIVYLVDAPYSAANNAGLRWNDPLIGVDWPVLEEAVVLSQADRDAPGFSALESPF
jgi:dTDP-4-dehydrorhamnose 3,5-epimerase